MNLEAFIAELVDDYRLHGCMDIDGGDFQEMLIKHGLCVERPATVEEAGEAWCQDYDIKAGDTIVADCPELAALRRRERAEP